ncbi:hypothetical protein ACFX5K_01730 [Rickettsiales bacterium LUAb2]
MNRISLLLLILLILISSSVFAATNKYYEIDFTYQNIINKKSYTEEAVLLRDKTWLEENNIHKAGDTLILNIPELGVINVEATAKEVKSTNLNPIKAYTNNQSMVTGKFKHYSTDVREYTLKNTKTGSIQNIQATPNHAFYVQNRTVFNKALNEQSHFIEIQNITSADKLINEAGNTVQLICNNKVCGKQLVTNNKPIAVYNLEVYKQHQYLVVSDKDNNSLFQLNNNAVLVHNNCDTDWHLSWASDLAKENINNNIKFTPPNRLYSFDSSGNQFSDRRYNIIAEAYETTMKDIQISTTGRNNSDRGEFVYNANTDRAMQYKDWSMGYTQSQIRELRLSGVTYSLMKELCAGNCGEQSSYVRHLLKEDGFNTAQYRYNSKIVRDHNVAIVFSNSTPTATPMLVVDPWAGVLFDFNNFIDFNLPENGLNSASSYIFEFVRSDFYPE